MRPTLRQLQYLVAVAETGRFSEAARRLNVSQPSLSSQLAEAEAQLGAKLIERAPGGAILTPAGEEVVRRARLILREVEDLHAAARQRVGTLAGRVRLGVLPSIGPYLLPYAVKPLHARHPDLRLIIRDASALELAGRLASGELDAVITVQEEHPDMVHAPLFTETLWVCAAPDDVLAGSDAPVGLAALEGRPVLSLGLGHHLRALVQSITERSGVHVSADYEGGSLDALRQMAATGAGVAILPSLYALSEARRDPDLVLRRIDHPMATRNIALAWRRTSPLAGPMATLAAVIREAAATLPGA